MYVERRGAVEVGEDQLAYDTSHSVAQREFAWAYIFIQKEKPFFKATWKW